MDTKICPITSFKFIDEGEGSFVGYGSVFHVKDHQNDVVLPGAFRNSLKNWIDRGHIFLNHDRNVSVATIDSAAEDDYGLKFQASFLSNTDGQRVRGMMRDRLKRGKDTGLSIGYHALKTKRRNDGAQELHEVKLLEVSVLTIQPANPQARVVEVKGALAEQFREIKAKCAREKVEAARRKVQLRMIMERMNIRHRQMGLI